MSRSRLATQGREARPEGGGQLPYLARALSTVRTTTTQPPDARVSRSSELTLSLMPAPPGTTLIRMT